MMNVFPFLRLRQPAALALISVLLQLITGALGVPVSSQLPNKLPITILPTLRTTEGPILAEQVRQAALETYFEGMTEEIASQLGSEAVPELLKLLEDPSFPRRDNVVAFLTYLGDDSDGSVDALAQLASSESASSAREVATPEDDRAWLLAPHALGHIAGRGSAKALSALLDLVSPSGKEELVLTATMTEQVLAGLAISKQPEALVRLAELSQGSRIPKGLGEGDVDAVARQSLLVLNEAAPGMVPSSAVLAAQLESMQSQLSQVQLQQQTLASQKRFSSAAALKAATTADTAAAAAAAGATAAAAISTTTVTYCNHPEVTSKMTNAQLDAVFSAGNSLLQTANPSYAGDYACTAAFARSGSGGTFGSTGDGFAVIDTSSESTTAMDSSCAWVKVVRVINYCGGPGTNIIGCGWINKKGVILVRYTALGNNGEGTLWVHELGHNAGLNHLSVTGNIMYPSVNTVGGLTSAQCTKYKSLSSSSSCFPASSRVHVQGKGPVPIAKLCQGDRVLDAETQATTATTATTTTITTYSNNNNNNNDNSNNNNNNNKTTTTPLLPAGRHSEFIAFLHAEDTFWTDFVAITHEHGVLKATPDHYIFKIDPETHTRTAIRADAFRAGDHVLFLAADQGAKGNGSAVLSRVTSVSTVQEQGIYGPLTESGSIVVDGVLSSCYADVVATSHETSHLTMLPLRWLYKTFPSLADKGPSDELHWYAVLLMKLVQAPGVSTFFDTSRLTLGSN